MERKFLEDLGIEKSVIDKILDENGKDIENAKADYENLKAELNTAKTTISDRDKQLSELKKIAADSEGLAKKIAELEEQNKTQAVKHKEELDILKINNAVEKALLSYKAKTPKAVRAMLDMNNIKIDKDGNVVGIEEQIKTLSEAEDTKYLFDSLKPVLRGTQPGYDGDDNGGVDIHNMTYSQMTAYLESHPGVNI